MRKILEIGLLPCQDASFHFKNVILSFFSQLLLVCFFMELINSCKIIKFWHLMADSPQIDCLSSF